MSLVRWDRPHFKSDLTPVKVERHNRKAEREKALEEAYAAVDRRDGSRCWVTGKALSPGSVEPATRREHHHLAKRSTAKDRRADPTNIITVSALAHDLITRGWIVVEGTRADRPLFFHWTSLATSKPLVIKRRNLPREGAVRSE